jgi:hypothetical protein
MLMDEDETNMERTDLLAIMAAVIYSAESASSRKQDVDAAIEKPERYSGKLKS